MLNGVRAAYLHTAVTGRSQCAAARPTPAAGGGSQGRSETTLSTSLGDVGVEATSVASSSAMVGDLPGKRRQVRRRNCALLAITKTYHGIRRITLHEVNLVAQGVALVSNMAAEKDGARMQ